MPRRPPPYVRDGVCLSRAFLTEAEFAQVRDDCRRLHRKMKREKNSVASGRMGCFVDRRSETHRVLTSTSVVERVARLVGQPMEASPHPIELRCYRVGAEMTWHRDDQLYDAAQCELVLCLQNSSDSVTEWVDGEGQQLSEWTRPNTALLVRAGDTGAAHRVTPLKRGERTILKMVWAVPGSTPLPAFFEHFDAFPGLRRKVRRGLQGRGRGR